MKLRAMFDSAMGEIRPFTFIAGVLVMAVGLAVYFFPQFVHISVGNPLEFAVAGWLMKSL